MAKIQSYSKLLPKQLKNTNYPNSKTNTGFTLEDNRKKSNNSSSIAQLVKDKKGDLAKKVESKWEITEEKAKLFVAWCNDEEEIDTWLDFDTYSNWQILQEEDPKEHNADKIALIIEKKTQPKKVIAKKPAEPKLSFEEEQMQKRLAVMDEAAKQKQSAKTIRQSELTSFGITPSKAIISNAILSAVWTNIEYEYVNRINGNLRLSTSYDLASLTTAMTIWKSNTISNSNVSYMSKFDAPQDKSTRSDGGTNAANLDTRKVQANFIIEINGYRINVHVDES